MMKKTVVFLTVLTLVASSCSVSKSARGQRNLISGTWTLNDVTFEGNEGTFKAVLFNDADAICFEGSKWFFRDNNSTGKYTIKDGSLCSGGERFIRWSVVEPAQNYSAQLQFKFIDEKLKDIAGGVGYKLLISNLTAQGMTLKSNVSVDGEPVTLVYKFTKN